MTAFFLFRFRFDMKGNIMTDMTLPRPAEVPALDFDTLAAKLKEEEVIPTDSSMTLHSDWLRGPLS